MDAQLLTELFSRKQWVILDGFFKNASTQTFGPQKTQALTLMLKCEQQGFGFDAPLLYAASHASQKELTAFWSWFSDQCARQYAPANYKPLYPNFPQQVIDATDEELLTNAFAHYAGDFFGTRILPTTREKRRYALQEGRTPITMRAVPADRIVSLFDHLVHANSVLSPSDQNLLKILFPYSARTDLAAFTHTLTHKKIAQKETRALLGALLLEHKMDFQTLGAPLFNTPTDLLRLCAAIYGGDVGLVDKTCIGSMSRATRRAFVQSLEQMIQKGDRSQILENLFAYKERWKRLAHALHIGEFSTSCPNAHALLSQVRANKKGLSFAHQVHHLLKTGNIPTAGSLLSSRPGVFARMLQHAVRLTPTPAAAHQIVDAFAKVSPSVATPVLLQMHAHYKYNAQADQKVIFPKAANGKAFVLSPASPNTTYAFTPVPEELAQKIVQMLESTLMARFAHAPSLGNVYVQEDLCLQFTPFAQRTASKALRTVPKGSRFVRKESKPVLRFFTWWNEQGKDAKGNPMRVGRVDIDLSLGIFDAQYNLISVCAFYELRRADYLTHSGDITSAPHGAAEYIDVHLEKLQQAMPNAAFIGQLVSSFTQQSYANLPECYAGWMERQDAQRGEIFDPSTVGNKVDITSNATQVLVCLYDLARQEFIWADTPINSASGRNNTLHSVKGPLAYTIEGLVTMQKPNLYDLFCLHAKARGTLVQDKAHADTIFALEDGTTPFDTQRIASDFMANEYGASTLQLKV